MLSDAKHALVAAQVARVLVLGSPRDEEQRACHVAELTGALGQFLLPDIESGVTTLVREWTRGRGWPLPSDVIGAVRLVRKSRFDALPAERRHERDASAVCRCGAVPRQALLTHVDPTTGATKVTARMIAPCDEQWHRARKQGWVPMPENFAGWVEDEMADAARERAEANGDD